MSSVPKPASTTRRRSAFPSPSVSLRNTISVLLETYTPPSPGATLVGMNRCSANSVERSARPSPSASSRTKILSSGTCPGFT